MIDSGEHVRFAQCKLSDEESVGGAGDAQIVPTTPRPLAMLRVMWMQFFWGKALDKGRGDKIKRGFASLQKLSSSLRMGRRQRGEVAKHCEYLDFCGISC